ncbi:MAG: PAS domain S-box protein [Bacteroidales bacterium]|nr:PAS domain S-box protein [Bacteroidales bacterium]
MQFNYSFLKNVLDIAPNPIFIYSTEQIIYVNEAAIKLMQASNANDLIGKNFAQYVHPDYIQISANDLKKLFEQQLPVVKSYLKIITLNKSIAEVEVSASLIDYNNKPAIIGIANNLTEVKQLNQKLIEYEKKLASIINQIPHLLFVVTKDGYIKEFFNPHYLPLYKKPKEFLNKNIEEIFPASLAEQIRTKIFALNTTKQNQELEYELVINNREQYFKAYFINFNENEILVSVLQLRNEDYIFKKLFVESQSIKLLINPENGKIVNANKAACEFYGYSFDEITQLNINQINILSDDEIKKAMQLEKENQCHFVNFKHRLKNGEIKEVEVYSGKIILNNQELLYSIIHDKTPVVEQERKFQNLFDNLIEAYALHEIITDATGQPIDYKYLEVNEAFLTFTGSKSKQDIIGKTVKELWPNTEQYWIDIFGKVALTGERISFENYWQVLDRWYLVNAFSPKKGQFAVSFIDITALKKTELQLKIYERAFQNAPASIIITNPWGKIQYVNPFFTQITGYHAQEVFNQNPSILKSGYHNKDFYRNLWETILSGETWIGEFYNKRKDGTYYWENARISPITNTKGEITHFVAIKIDITKQKQMQQALIAAKEKAEQSEKLKTNFLANMSHEIRTPLNAIMGFTELLRNTPITEEEKQEYLKVIAQSSNRLFNLINDILEISKIETGEISVTKNIVEVDKEFDFIYQNLKLEAEEKKLSFFLNPTFPRPLTIETDKSKLLSIVTNLVKNAIKYTHSGYVEFGYVLKGSILEINVKDTGIGIPKEKQNIIFERFVQADMRSNKPYEGVGLGLSIVKSYVEMLKGNIKVNSEVEKGSTFTVKIPVQLTAYQSIENNEQEQLTKPLFQCTHLLIVEDDPSSGDLLTIFLQAYCKQIFRAQNANEALQILQQHPIQIVFSDIKLPDMNGFDLLKEIKKHNPNIIVIGQSGFAMEDDIKAALAEGFDFYITKPFSQNTINRLMNDIAKGISK